MAPSRIAPPIPTTTPIMVLRVLGGMPDPEPSLEELRPGAVLEGVASGVALVLVEVMVVVKVDWLREGVDVGVDVGSVLGCWEGV